MSSSLRLSLLDLATVSHGQAIGEALHESLTLAERADEAGAADVRLAGALTLQASADLLPARTADRYIDLKKSGRL